MVYKLIGIGIGPTNLSLATLIYNKSSVLKDDDVIFFDKKKEFSWHSDQLFPSSLMQNSFLRDLITPIDPTSKFTFLNYLKKKEKLYQFLNSGIILPYREEYTDYMKWVNDQIPFLKYNNEIQKVFFNKKTNLFEVKIKGLDEKYFAKNIIIGTGIQKRIPFKFPIDSNVIHVSDFFKMKKKGLVDKKVMVIGSGQSSAELIINLLSNEDIIPKELCWVTRDTNFRELDTGNFSREFYTQEYAQLFYLKNQEIKDLIHKNEANAGKGISPTLLNTIYSRIYFLKNVKGYKNRIKLFTEFKIESISNSSSDLEIKYYHYGSNDIKKCNSDIVICCTGFSPVPLDFIFSDINLKGDLLNYIKNDYSISGIGNNENKVYTQSYSIQNHSLSDPNLSISAVRNGFLINKIFDDEIYKLPKNDLLVEW